GGLELSLFSSTTEPADCSLTMQLTSSKTVSLSMEPVTGRFALQPSSLSLLAEQQLNNPTVEAYAVMRNFRAWVVDDEITSRAISVGWERYRHSFKLDEVKSILPPDTLR